MAMSQIKINPSGTVFIGPPDVTWVGCALKINYSVGSFTFLPDHGKRIFFGGHNQTQSTTRVEFWHPVAEWNKIRIKGYDLSSDSTFKTSIMLIENATTLLKQINTYSYYFKSDSSEIRSDSLDLRKRDYGVLAQEVEAILPDLVDTCKGDMFVNYNAFIAILIKGFNEQQTLIESQQNEIEILQNIVSSQEQDFLIELKSLKETVSELKRIVSNCCGGGPKGDLNILDIPENPQPSQEKPILYQNNPNPFSSNTEITCNLPETTKHAVIYIYNLQGAELKSYTLTQIGLNSITVYASELSAGMYLYTLVADNEIIDTKRMILTK